MALLKEEQLIVKLISFKSYDIRPCLQLNTYITRDEEMDYAVKSYIENIK